MVRFLICVALFSVAVTSWAADGGKPSRLFDADDGWLDLSQFLDTAYGFVPLISPITEPAVGYGAAAALVFIDRQTSQARNSATRVQTLRPSAELRPKTERADSLQDTSEHGLTADCARRPPSPTPMSIWSFLVLAAIVIQAMQVLAIRLAHAVASLAAATVLDRPRYGSDFVTRWQRRKSAWISPATALPGVTRDDRDLRLAGLTPSLTLDLRDNFFTPTDGWYADLSLPVFREWLGGDRDYEELSLSAIRYQPLSRSLFLSIRAAGKSSSDGTPFYLRPYVSLRGVQALRYQGEQAAEVEAELRWQAHRRFSVVAFAGAGVARSETFDRDHKKTVTAGGAGFRYLLARTYGLHMGLDVAVGPDKPIFYVVFGHAWLRP